MDEFNELVQQMQKERMRVVMEENEERQHLGENIYLMFCVWLYSEGHDKKTHNANLFADYLSDNGITLTKMQRMYLAKKYFGYKGKE